MDSDYAKLIRSLRDDGKQTGGSSVRIGVITALTPEFTVNVDGTKYYRENLYFNNFLLGGYKREAIIHSEDVKSEAAITVTDNPAIGNGGDCNLSGYEFSAKIESANTIADVELTLKEVLCLGDQLIMLPACDTKRKYVVLAKAVTI